jgi:hypothetical protein
MYQLAAKRCRKQRRLYLRSEGPVGKVTMLNAPVSQKDTGAAEPKAEAAKRYNGSLRGFAALGVACAKDVGLEIRHGLKTCYAQWEDVGPFCTDSAGYVFGNERPPPNVNPWSWHQCFACRSGLSETRLFRHG